MKKFISILCALVLVLAVATGCERSKNGTNRGKITVLIKSKMEAFIQNNPAEIIALIKTNFDILAESNLEEIQGNAGEINSELFDEIVALGEKALPFLERITNWTDEEISWYPGLEFEHRLLAVHAIYAIKPEKYDILSLSPNGEYTAQVAVASFAMFYNHGQNFNIVQIVKNATGEIVCEADMTNVVGYGGIYDAAISWSADNKFAVIECSGRRWGSAIAINVQTKDCARLPGEEEMIAYVFPGENYGSLISVPRFWFEVDSWENKSVVKISYILGEITNNREFSGWYTYDLNQGKILEIDYCFIV